MSRSIKFANLIFLIGIICCITLLLYVISLSNSRTPATLYKYLFIILVFLAVLLGLLFKGTDPIKVRASLLFLSTGLCLYIIELILGIYLITHIAGAKKRLRVDTPDKFQVMMDLRKSGINAYPHVFPSNYLLSDGLYHNGTKIFPLGAISRSTTVFCINRGIPVIYETDEHGFRNPEGQYTVPGLDIALIGDSFTQGLCVKNGEDIAGKLREKNMKVLNLEMEGSGPLIELGLLSEYAKPFKPKRVFWLYFEGNDMPNLNYEKTPTLMKYLNNDFSQNLAKRQEEIDNALIEYVETEIALKNKQLDKINNSLFIKSSFTFQVLSDLMIQSLKLNTLRMKVGLHGNCLFYIEPLFEEIMTQVKGRVEEWGGHLYFVYLPTNERYGNNLCDKRRLPMQREKIVSLAKELDIPVIDITEHFDAHEDPLSLFSGHYNARGYRLVAQKIEERIADDSH